VLRGCTRKCFIAASHACSRKWVSTIRAVASKVRSWPIPVRRQPTQVDPQQPLTFRDNENNGREKSAVYARVDNLQASVNANAMCSSTGFNLRRPSPIEWTQAFPVTSQLHPGGEDELPKASVLASYSD
jgi:hypothetical protein